MVLGCFTWTWKVIVYVTEWKASKHGVFYSPYFPVFGLGKSPDSVRCKSSDSVRIRENKHQKKNPFIGTLYVVGYLLELAWWTSERDSTVLLLPYFWYWLSTDTSAREIFMYFQFTPSVQGTVLQIPDAQIQDVYIVLLIFKYS